MRLPTVLPSLLGHEAHEENGERRKEDGRFAHRHHDAGDLLVAERREIPDAGRFLVEAVDRAREEREQEAERAREDERCEEVRAARAVREAPGALVENGPPEEESRYEVGEVLQVQERVVAEGRVVERRQVQAA